MLSIYTYPNNSGTGYIDPDYYGSTTGGSETGYYKRILDLKDGTYKTWATGQTAPVDTVSDLISATGKFHKGVRTENGLENIQIYSYYNQPLITLDSVLINTNITSSDTDASPAARLTVVDSSDLVDGDQVLLTGFDGTLADQNNLNFYVDIIDSTTVDLYYDSALLDPLKYASLITGQAVANIDYDSLTPFTEIVKVDLTGLGAAYDFGNVTFDTTGGTNLAQDRLSSMGQFFLRHDTGNTFDLYPQAGGGAGLTIDDFINDNYTDFGIVDQPLEFVTSGSTINYKVATNTAGNKMYGVQAFGWRTGGNSQYEDGATKPIPNWTENEIFTPSSTGDTGIDANLGYRETKYHWGMSAADLTPPGHGYYVSPQYYSSQATGSLANYPVNAFYNKNYGPSTNINPGNVTYPRIQTNYDGLAASESGQNNNGTNVVWNYNDDEWTYVTQPDNTTGPRFAYDSKDWVISSVGNNSTTGEPGTYPAITANGNTPWGSLPQSMMTSAEYAGLFPSFMKTEVVWNPNSTTDMKPIQLKLTFLDTFGTSYTPPTPAIWQELNDIWDGTSTEQGVYCNITNSSTSGSIEAILVPIAKEPDPQWTSYDRFTCTIFDARIWDVDYGKNVGATDRPTEYEGSHPSFEQTPYNGFTSTLTRASWPTETTPGTNPSGYGPYVGGSVQIYTAERSVQAGGNGLPYLVDKKLFGSGAVYLTSFYPGPGGPSQSVFTTTNNDTYFDKIRTGTLAWSVLGGGFNGAMKLLTSSSTTKTFAICPATGGTTSLPTAIDWSTHLTLTSNQLAGALTNQGTVFPVNSYAFDTYFQTTNLGAGNEDIYMESEKVRYFEMKQLAGTTATVGASVTDSTTGNIALAGTHNHKGDNPHIYFPGNQTYQQRTGASTYVNGATVSDDFYDIDSSTADDFTSGTKPSLTVSQSTEGYIDGVSLGSTGRITTGQKMLSIDTLADTYTPPAPTPAEEEDIWNTADQWASNGDTTPEKVWPHHVTPMSAVINYNAPTLVNNSQSGIKYTRSVGHTKWRLEVEYPPMSAEDFQKFHAIAQAAHGQSTPFLFKLQNKDGVSILWKDFYDQTTSTTTPRIKDAVTPGDTTLLVEGFNSNESFVFREGEVFIDGENENGNLHTSLVTQSSNVYGEVKIRTPWPFRTAQVAGTKIYKDPEHAIVTFASDNFEYQVDVNNYYFVSVAFDLDSWK